MLLGGGFEGDVVEECFAASFEPLGFVVAVEAFGLSAAQLRRDAPQTRARSPLVPEQLAARQDANARMPAEGV